MRRALLLSLAVAANAARPFLEEPDTGQAEQYGSIKENGLPKLDEIIGLPDFQYVARGYMNTSAYTFYRNGAAGEWSYRNNLEAFQRMRFRPRVMNNINQIDSSLPTTILGHNFSAPFFIAPAAQAGLANSEEGETSIVRGAALSNILYIPSDQSTSTKAEIQAARADGQVLLQQLYIHPANDTEVTRQLRQAEDLGFDAIVMTVDVPADGNRHRALRFGVGTRSNEYASLTWDDYRRIRERTRLPVIPKGITTVEDAIMATQVGVPVIYLSNHGGRQLDGSPSPLEIALEIYDQAPWVFQHTEVWADGGVRYGTDVLKLLALGVRAVGVGRPFVYANIYGADGVVRACDILKREIAHDAGNLGVGDLKRINASYIDVRGYPTSWGM